MTLRVHGLTTWLTKFTFAAMSLGYPLADGYSVKRITNDNFNNRWPSINSQGDIVWARQVNGNWQIYRQVAGSTSGVLVPLPDGANHNHMYPAIDDDGNLLYLNDNVGG